MGLDVPLGLSGPDKPRNRNDEGNDGEPTPTDREGDEKLDLGDDVADLLEVGFGGGAPALKGFEPFHEA